MIVHMHIFEYPHSEPTDRHYCFNIVLCYVFLPSKRQLSSSMLSYYAYKICRHLGTEEINGKCEYINIDKRLQLCLFA
jgi:hypothetical protein